MKSVLESLILFDTKICYEGVFKIFLKFFFMKKKNVISLSLNFIKITFIGKKVVFGTGFLESLIRKFVMRELLKFFRNFFFIENVIFSLVL